MATEPIARAELATCHGLVPRTDTRLLLDTSTCLPTYHLAARLLQWLYTPSPFWPLNHEPASMVGRSFQGAGSQPRAGSVCDRVDLCIVGFAAATVVAGSWAYSALLFSSNGEFSPHPHLPPLLQIHTTSRGRTEAALASPCPACSYKSAWRFLDADERQDNRRQCRADGLGQYASHCRG